MRKLKLEALEQRRLLAGDVRAFFSGDNLIVYPTADDTTVEISYDGADILVEGLAGTTVNGSAAPFVAVAGDTLPGSVSLRDNAVSDNSYHVHDLALLGNLIADGETITVDDVYVGGNALLRGETNNASGLTVAASLQVRDGSATLSDLDIGATLLVLGTSGDDVISIDDATANRIYVRASYGDDTVAITNSAASTLYVLGGPGTDSLDLTGTVAGRELVRNFEVIV